MDGMIGWPPRVLLLLWLGVAITQRSVGGPFEQIDKKKGGKPPAGGLDPAIELPSRCSTRTTTVG